MQLYPMKCTIDGDDLYELKDGRFQFLRSGETAPLMGEFFSNEAYHVLADNKLADFLCSLDLDQVTCKPAVLWHRGADEEVHTHSLVSIGKSVERVGKEAVESDGYQMCFVKSQRYFGILVNTALRDALKKKGFKHLSFGKGHF
jgi:hypothetical protein